MRYAFIERERATYPVARMCRWLAVSPSGYYAWRQRQPSARTRANDALQVQIEQVFARSRSTYGSPRVTAALRQAGVRCNRKRVMRLMRRAGLQAKMRRKRVRTTVTDTNLPVAPNLLNREFSASAPNQKWLSDITLIATQEGWLFLAVVLDLYARTVVGWAMDTHMRTELVERALTMARQQRLPDPHLLFHSDRGGQYQALLFKQHLTEAEMRASMSRTGNCWDNAPIESFFGTLKTECADRLFGSRAEARTAIFTYIETWYNRQRLHSTNAYLSPLAKELAFWQSRDDHGNDHDPIKGERITTTTTAASFN
jgi:transposase InsO family protein